MLTMNKPILPSLPLTLKQKFIGGLLAFFILLAGLGISVFLLTFNHGHQLQALKKNQLLLEQAQRIQIVMGGLENPALERIETGSDESLQTYVDLDNQLKDAIQAYEKLKITDQEKTLLASIRSKASLIETESVAIFDLSPYQKQQALLRLRALQERYQAPAIQQAQTLSTIARERLKAAETQIAFWDRLTTVVMVFIFGAATLLMFFFTWLFTRLTLTPILRIIDGVRQVQKGDFGQEIIVQSGDEVEELAREFNRMRLALRINLSDLSERNLQLEKLNRLATGISLSMEMTEALEEILKIAMETLNASGGAITFGKGKGNHRPLLSGIFSESVLRHLDGLPVQSDLKPRFVNAEELSETGPLLDAMIQSVAIIPLASQDQTETLLYLAFSRQQEESISRLIFLETLGHQAGILLENFSLFDQVKENLRKSSLVHQASQQIIGGMVSNQILQTLCDVVARDFGYRMAWAGLAAENYMVIPAAHAGFEDNYPDIIRVRYDTSPLGAGPTGTAIRNRKPVIFNRLEEHPDFTLWREEAIKRNYRSILALPFISDQKALGALTIYSDEESFPQKDLMFLQVLVNEVAIILDKSFQYEKLREKTQFLAVINHLDHVISSNLDLNLIYRSFFQGLARLVPFDQGRIGLFNENLSRIRTEASYPEEDSGETLLDLPALHWKKGAILNPEETPVGEILQRKLTYLIGFQMMEGETAHDPEKKVAYLAILFGTREEWDGMVLLTSCNGKEFQQVHVEIVQNLCKQLAVAVENASLYGQLQDYSFVLEEKIALRTAELKLKNEELEQVAQSRADFISMASHDLRTPLTSILGFCELFLSNRVGPMDSDQLDLIKHIYESGNLLHQIIEDLRDISLIDAGQMRIEKKKLEAPYWIAHSVATIERTAKNKKIQIALEVEGTPHVEGDPNRFQQMLINYLTNAVKFTPEGGKITIRAEEAGGSVRISVQDTGIGIAPQDQKMLFKRYSQVGKQDNRIKGTGLGLAIVKSLAEIQGGSVGVESEPGNGSTFWFSLPIYAGSVQKIEA